MVEPIRLGSIIFWPRSGMLAGTLSQMMKVLDPDPGIRSSYPNWSQIWHASQVVAFKNNDWQVDQAIAPHSDVIPFSEMVKTHGKGYRIYNWLPEITQAQADAFLKEFHDYPYAYDSYIWVALNRLSRDKFPRIAARRLMCWDRTAAFTMFNGKPLMHYYEEAYMPLMVQRCESGIMPEKLIGEPATWYKTLNLQKLGLKENSL